MSNTRCLVVSICRRDLRRFRTGGEGVNVGMTLVVSVGVVWWLGSGSSSLSDWGEEGDG